MQEISYFNAWMHWISSKKVDEYFLWGIQIIWWGRIGKILQLISAATIIADILGAEKLQELGGAIRKTFPPNKAIIFLKRSFGWLGRIIERVLDGSSNTSTESLSNKYKDLLFGRFNKFIVTLTLLFFWLFCYEDFNKFINEVVATMWEEFGCNTPEIFGTWRLFFYLRIILLPTILATLLYFVGIYFIFVPFYLAIIMISLSFIIMIINVFVLQPLAYVLQKKEVENWIRIISLLVFLFGFHFDLLAS